MVRALREVKLAAIQTKVYTMSLKLFIDLTCGGITHPAQTHVVAALLQIQGLQELLHCLGKGTHEHNHYHTHTHTLKSFQLLYRVGTSTETATAQ